MKVTAAVALAAAQTAVAQQAAWGQCGGQGYSGQTTCVTGYYCAYTNQYYSQCVPGTAGTTTLKTSTTSKAATTTAKTSTTSKAATTTAKTTTTAAPPASTAGSYAKTSGLKFNIDGKTGYFAGTNAYWLSYLTSDADIDLVMSHLQTSGLKILRIWGFNDVNTVPSAGTVYFQALTGSSPTINTGANGLQRLDYVVKSAEAHGIKLIINFVNNWTDYGGIDAYVSYYGLANHQAWYTSTAAQAQYKKYIEAVVSRYKTSTAVFAWELANEPRCNGCSTDVIYNWATTTSQYIKSLDSNHLVTLGDEGWAPSAGDGSYPYGKSEGVDFARNLGIATLDFGTYHMYPTSWGVSESTFPTGWIQAHGAACSAAGKPCLFEEYGSVTDHTQYTGWATTALNDPGHAGDLFWQLGDTPSGTQDGNTIYYGTSEWNSIVLPHVANVKTKNGF